MGVIRNHFGTFSYSMALFLGIVILPAWAGLAIVEEVQLGIALRNVTEQVPDRQAVSHIIEVPTFGATDTGEVTVPRLFLTSFPDDWPGDAPVELVKQGFVALVLPHVLAVNDTVLEERERLLAVNAGLETGLEPSAADRLWLENLGERYETDPADIAELITRVDVIPPSLALTQAAIESGWGRSRFAREGQALYGQWTWTEGAGIVPLNRPPDESYEVKRFNSLQESVRDYVMNLNTFPAYSDFRRSRAEQRIAGSLPSGVNLVDELARYSIRGEEYVAELREVLRINRLDRYDTAQLVSF